MFSKISNTPKSLSLAVFSLIALISLTLNVGVQAAPTVTPATAMDSASNPIYALDMTSCLEVFNWPKYLSDLAKGITNTNPYDKLSCVRQTNLATNGTRTVTKDAAGKVTNVNYNVGATQITKTKYADFTIGQANTKQALGNLPVLGLFPNGSYTAQALNTYDVDGTQRTAVAPVNRAELNGLSSIFPTNKLNQIYSTGGARTGLPRIPFTGPETFAGDVYMGGFCKTEAGKIKIRTSIPDKLGNQFTVADYNEDPASPITTCRWPDNSATRTSTPPLFDADGVVKDQNLSVYQFIYKIPYPKDKAECDSWFPGVFSDYTKCLGWFQERYSLPLTGQKTGNALYYTYTYYGAFDDKYNQWIGWENPDINKARATFTSSATLEQLRAYYQDPEQILRQLFSDQTSTRSQLITKMNSASQAVKDQYRAILKDKYESYIRNADGYSVYTM